MTEPPRSGQIRRRHLRLIGYLQTESTMACLVLEQPAFARQAAAIAGQPAIAADDAMARHNDTDGIAPVGEPHGPDGFGFADAFGERTITECRPARYGAKRIPHL